MTLIEKLTRCAVRCDTCANKREDSFPELAAELREDGEAIREAIKKLEKQKPMLKEVVEYGVEIMLPEKESHTFFDHFQSNGWKVGGKAVMKDWKAAMRNWRRRWAKENPTAARNGSIVAVNGEPDGWARYIISKKIQFIPYARASQWMKEEFAKGGAR